MPWDLEEGAGSCLLPQPQGLETGTWVHFCPGRGWEALVLVLEAVEQPGLWSEDALVVPTSSLDRAPGRAVERIYLLL